MDLLIALLFFITVIATIFGLIKPSLILWWDSNPKRWKVFGIGLGTCILLVVLINLMTDDGFWYTNGKEYYSQQKYQSAIRSFEMIDPSFEKYDEVQELIEIADSLHYHKKLVEKQKKVQQKQEELLAAKEKKQMEIQQILEKLETPTNVEEVLVNLTNEEVDQLEEGSLERSFTENEVADSLFKITLVENLDVREDFIQIRAKEERKELINEQFGYGGRHKLLTYYIKDNMHDPKSFDHVNSVYDDKGDYLLVQMKFRGKNTLGALVLNQVIAKTTIEGGYIIEIVSYQTL